MKRIVHPINTVPHTQYSDNFKPTRQRDNPVNFKKVLMNFIYALYWCACLDLRP